MKKFYVLMVLALLSGCANTHTSSLGAIYKVEIDSIVAKDIKPYKTFVLLSGQEGVDSSDLFYQEVESYVRRALELKGYESGSFEDADLAIFLSFGIGEPQKEVASKTVPVWGQTGVRSSNTYGTLSTFGNTSTINATTTYTPTYGITGYNSYVSTSYSYFRYANISAFDLKEYQKSKTNKQVWNTIITSKGSTSDLRRAAPVLIGASVPYLGTNTEKQISLRIYENASIVKQVKGIDVEVIEEEGKN